MRSRTILRAAVVAALLATGIAPATAAPKICKLIEDPAGDGGGRIVPGESPPTDVLVADVASGKQQVKARLTLASLETQNNPQTIQGADWSISWDLGTTGFAFRYSRRINEEDTKTFYVDHKASPAKFTVDFNPTAKTITWTIDQKADPVLYKLITKKGAKFVRISVSTQVYVGVAIAADAAVTQKTYTAGTPSCLEPK